MERDRFFPSSTPNPNLRNLGFLSDRNREIIPPEKPIASPILDQFKDLVRQREEELRYEEDYEDDVAVLGMNEIVRIYEIVLSELTINSKPIITELTMIAGEQREFAEGIADVLCARIIEVPVEQKLPSLYLLDSIVKNIGGEYVRYFSSRLPEVFVEAYRQVDPNQHTAMRHLFGTWSVVFPSSVLRKIAVELQFSSLGNNQPPGTGMRSSESPSPRPAHGIHVNPKYLEARRQYENASALNEIHDVRGVSSSLQRYGQKPAIGLEEYDIDNPEAISQQVEIRRVGSPGMAARGSITGEKRHLSPNCRLLRPSSPSRVRFPDSVSAPDDGYTIEKSPNRVVERASPVHGGLEYPPSRLNKMDGEWNDGRMKHTTANIQTRLGTDHKIEFDRQRPRALIDAYGNYRGESNLTEKHVTIERLDVNKINNETTKKWQNTEEEEYVWEDMSPTPADRSRSNDLFPSHPSSQNASTRPGFERPPYMEPDYRAGYWPAKSQLPRADDNSIFTDDRSILRPNLGDIGTNSIVGGGNRNNTTQIQGPKYSREPWNAHSHQYNPEVSGKCIQTSIPPVGTVQPTRQRVPSLVDSTDDYSSMQPTEKHFGQRSHSPPMPSQRWPQRNGISLPIHPQHNQIKSRSDLLDANRPLTNQGANDCSFLPHQQLDSIERKAGTSNLPFRLPNQLPGSTYLNNQSQVPVPLPPHGVKPMNYVSQNISPLLPQPFNRGRGVLTSVPLNRVSGIHPSVPGYGIIPNTSFQVSGGAKPPLPPGPPPLPSSQNVSQPPSSGFTDLISSLMAQGMIKLTGPLAVQDSVGVEFNPDVLKVRHESSIKALYADLPRQCKTCGLRFKSQEEHSTHMDWHVTRNRISKKSKQKPSRKWFVSTTLWLSGAETVGNDAGPGFLPSETSVIEKKDDEVMAVPADENQSACALCGEPFDDFYSDETEEWMYKGAVYLNAPDGLTAGMDRSQLGPIVHSKCRSESTVVSSEDRGKPEVDGSQPKRIRFSL